MHFTIWFIYIYSSFCCKFAFIQITVNKLLNYYFWSKGQSILDRSSWGYTSGAHLCFVCKMHSVWCQHCCWCLPALTPPALLLIPSKQISSHIHIPWNLPSYLAGCTNSIQSVSYRKANHTIPRIPCCFETCRGLVKESNLSGILI